MLSQVIGRTRLQNGILELEGQLYNVTSLGFEEMASGYDITVESFQIIGYEQKMDVARAKISPKSSTPPQYVKREGTIKDYPISGSGTLLCLCPDGTLRKVSYDDGNENQYNLKEEYGRGCYVSWIAGNKGLVFAEICEPPYQKGDLIDLDINSLVVPGLFRQAYKSLAGF